MFIMNRKCKIFQNFNKSRKQWNNAFVLQWNFTKRPCSVYHLNPRTQSCSHDSPNEKCWPPPLCSKCQAHYDCTKELEEAEVQLSDRTVCGSQEEEILNLKRRIDGYQRNLVMQTVVERASEWGLGKKSARRGAVEGGAPGSSPLVPTPVGEICSLH